jgi:hypothetical protein
MTVHVDEIEYHKEYIIEAYNVEGYRMAHGR